jgi:hypothetical protein
VVVRSSALCPGSPLLPGRFLVLERRILRYIFGLVEENGIWRKRYNHELYKLFNEPDIIGFIKVKMLEWAGHITRASENRTIKKPEGNRKWEDQD